MSIKLKVKSDPKGVLKGEYLAETDRDRLVLTQGKKRHIEVPVGTDAEYLGGNRFEFDTEDARVNATVSKFGLYQDRLANDLVEFLRGERSEVDLSDYKIPWFLYGLSVLPIGIPILTLGGALPAMVGVGTAAVCFAVAQKEDLAMPLRIAGIVLIVIAAYSMFFAAITNLAQRFG